MEANHKSTRIHPLVATAAVAVTLVSLVGAAAITGILPTSHSTTAPVASLSTPAATHNTGVATLAPAEPSALQSKPAVSQESDKPAPKAVKKPAPVKERQSSRPAPVSYAQQSAPAPRICYDCGRVESVQAVQQPAQPSGVGIVAGAVLGGVLGNQVGGGNGKKLATVAGAVGGGYAGNEIEKRTRATTTYQVRVRMEDGSTQTFPQSNQDGWRTGDRVRVVNGTLTARG